MAAGHFTFVLHSHLPWVLNHGRWPHGVDWLNEAMAETYLPLWRVLSERASRGPLGVTVDFSPVLCEQLAHPDFHREFRAYCEQKIAAAAEDEAWLAKTGDRAMAALARRWHDHYRATLEDFLGPHGANVVARFRRLEEQGAIEIFTCGATHGYFPLLGTDLAVDNQIRTARMAHRRHFGRDPRGIWLPECAYRPRGAWTNPTQPDAAPVAREGVEEIVARHALRYFFVDTHLLAGGTPLGVYADRFEALRHVVRADGEVARRGGHPPYRAYRVGDAPAVSCFGRDAVTAMQVWSGEHGYPGDGSYLDFHKKRFPGGHRYWAVTHPKADLANKRVYDPEAAAAAVPRHADHFVAMLGRVLGEASRGQDVPPIVCAMFDTELFGHWWSEGPAFLAAVLDRLDADAVAPAQASAWLDRHPAREVVALPEGSWGDGGGHQVWLNDGTRWTWAQVHEAERRFEALARRAGGVPGDAVLDRLLDQAGRELLLLEASDWQFLITTFAARDYAELRLAEHADDFARLARLAEQRLDHGALTGEDERWLAECEKRDAVFPDWSWKGYLAEGEPATTR